MRDDEDLTFRYMSRFQCIGPACEEHCCGGWRVDVDAAHVKMLKLAAGQAGSDGERIRKAFKKREDPPAGKKRAPKGQEPYVLKLDAQGNCVLLETDRRCHIHATLGEKVLPNVCATYPRRIMKIGERTQLTAGASCPEVARQVLLYDDALEPVPLERAMMPRKIVQARVDTRDIRPYLRLMPEVRAFASKRLSEASRPFSHRLFALALLAHRTQTILAKKPGSGDLDTVLEELRRLDDPAVLDEIGRRFDTIRTPALPVLVVARELVRGGATRNLSFRKLVASVFDTYARLDVAAFRREAGTADAAMSAAIQAAYETRRDRALALAGPRIDRYLRNFTLHAWSHHLQTDAPDLMVFSLRLLLHLAAVRFLFYSHPRMQAWFAEHPETGPEEVEAFGALCDELMVEVVRKLARYIDHSKLMTLLEQMLAEKQMQNLGGAVHLIQF